KRDIDLVQPLNHLANAILTHNLELADLLQKARMLHVDAVAEDVNLVALLFGGQFRACDKFDAGVRASAGGRLATFHSVMISQGYNGQMLAHRLLNQLIRPKSAIGKKGVEMEVGKPAC